MQSSDEGFWKSSKNDPVSSSSSSSLRKFGSILAVAPLAHLQLGSRVQHD